MNVFESKGKCKVNILEMPYTIFPIHKPIVDEIINSCLPRKYRVKKEKHKCLLPRCKVMTDHNGGYCCAEHCKEHKRK